MNLELYVCPVVVDDATSSSNHVTSMLVLTTTLLLVPQLPLGEKHEYLPPMIISVPVMNYHESIPNNCRPNTAAMFRLKYYWSSKQPKTIIDLKETSSSESNRLTACRARNRCSWPPSEVPQYNNVHAHTCFFNGGWVGLFFRKNGGLSVEIHPHSSGN